MKIKEIEENKKQQEYRLLVKNENINQAIVTQEQEMKNNAEKYPIKLYEKAALNSHLKSELKSNNPHLVPERNNSFMIERKEIPFISINSFMKMWSKICEDEFKFSSPPEMLLDVHKELINRGNSLFLNSIKIQDSKNIIDSSNDIDEAIIVKEIQYSKIIMINIL